VIQLGEPISREMQGGAVLLLLTGCTSSGTPKVVSVSTKQPTNIPIATSTSFFPIPTVGPVPLTCPISNPTRHSIGGMGLIGRAPAWAAWPPGPSVFQEGPITNTSPYNPGHGWDMTKVVWEVGPNCTHTITIQGYELFNHTPLLIQIVNNTPTAHAVLDPHNPGHPRSVIGGGWAEWGSYIVVPKAGCYVLEVSWPKGHWTLKFAFGA
jgi:hypothetical protein